MLYSQKGAVLTNTVSTLIERQNTLIGAKFIVKDTRCRLFMEDERGIGMQDWRNLRFINSKEYGKSKCGIGWSWRKTRFTDFDIWYVLAGEGEIHINGERYGVEQGTCCIFRPGDRVQAFQNPDHQLTIIFFHFRILDLESGKLLDDESALPPRNNIVYDRYWLEQYLHSLLDFAGKDDIYSHEMINHLLKLILIQLLFWDNMEDYKNHFRHRHLMKKVTDHIHRHISRPIHREELAQLVLLSPRYLSRLFKEYSGYSLREYIKKTRLDKARKLLTETDKNVTEVAETLGYKDIYRFSNQFKEQYGTSPLHYQQNVRKSLRRSIAIQG